MAVGKEKNFKKTSSDWTEKRRKASATIQPISRTGFRC
jgi:hypothetical protein